MKRLHVFILMVLFAYLFYWRWQVAATRFFDIDEFAYLHWTAAVARGERLYTDVFSYFTPGFFWVMTPVFWIMGRSAQVFPIARVISFVFFLGSLGALCYVWKITKNATWALLPAVILAFLPMPYDKFLEIRPDNLAALLGLLGLIGQIRGWWLFSGLTYSASLFVLAKGVPVVAVGALFALLRRAPRRFWAGLILPWVLFFVFSENFSTVWYSLTRLPFEVYKSAVNYPMEANLFFYPNASFYGGNGITPGLVVNHALWVLAILVGAYRLVTSTSLEELLIPAVFFVSVLGYVKYFPLKHSQYLIPIALFVAYFAADGLAAFFTWFTRAAGAAAAAVVLIGFAYLLSAISVQVNSTKLLATQKPQLDEINRLLRTVPPDARVVDLEGRAVFWPDGYAIAALPFDTFFGYLTRPPQTLAASLAAGPADYVYQGDSGRLGMLSPENLSYVRTHFVAAEGFGDRLWQKAH